MSQRRTGFLVDAKSMGLATSKSNKQPAACPAANQQMEQQQSMEERFSASALFTPHNELHLRSPTAASASGAAGAAETVRTCHSQCKQQCSKDPLPTDYYRAQLKKLRETAGDAAAMNYELNSIFIKRLEELDSLDEQCGGDASNQTPQMRLITFQEWVDLLLHVNHVIFGNVTSMEKESCELIMNCFQSVRGEQQQVLEENRKLRKDMCAIIKLVQEAFHHNAWNTDNICLETLSVNQLLGIQTDAAQCRPQSESEKVTERIKSLANEVAAKHDEVCHMQNQICALDEVVQTARQKIILKDKCIAQLNQQLTHLQDALSKMAEPGLSKELPTESGKECETSLSKVDISSSMFDDLNEKDQHSNELLRLLNNEFMEYIELISKKDEQTVDCRKKFVECFFERFKADCSNTVQKLAYIRAQLERLHADANTDCWTDTPIATCDTLSEHDPEYRLIESLRRRMFALNECNKKLNDQCQRREAELKMSALHSDSRYQAERAINEKTSNALKQIAELLTRLRCSDLSYADYLTDSSAENPFCVAISEIFDKVEQLELDLDKERQAKERLICQVHSLQSALKDREQQITQLNSMVNNYVSVVEAKKLQEEIFKLKQKNSEQSQRIREIAALLKAQEDEREKLCNKHESLMNTSEDQFKELRRANKEVQSLQQRLSQVEKRQEELKMERNLLRDEVLALKEKDAKQTGRDRATCDQLKLRQQELDKSQCLVHDMQAKLDQEQRQHRETVDRLCQANEAIRMNMRSVSYECKQMQLKLKQQTDVNEQQQQIIQSFRKWKDAQIRSDEAVRQCTKRAEEHINMLLEENNRLCEEYRRIYSDYCLLEVEMRRVKKAVNDTGLPISDSMQSQQIQPSDDMLRRLRSTRQRITNQCKSLNNDSSILPPQPSARELCPPPPPPSPPMSSAQRRAAGGQTKNWPLQAALSSNSLL
ncbi:kinesin-related protein 4 isoform X2 [Drosophila busckii]|uniref:kinesin-related protein 4 isoform X2 n=1 Tax=Drosophila busckii TaxID=30019 RepID=UPI0014333153|nr:kinesin-related protein 4 isoform X2 [Drosophila busckii]